MTYGTFMAKTTIESLRKALKKAHDKYEKQGGWRRVAGLYGLTGRTAWRIANDESYEPKEPRIRQKLGLPVLLPAPACSQCGKVHVTKRCTAVKRRTSWRQDPELLFDTLNRLERILEEIEEQ